MFIQEKKTFLIIIQLKQPSELTGHWLKQPSTCTREDGEGDEQNIFGQVETQYLGAPKVEGTEHSSSEQEDEKHKVKPEKS